MMTRTASFALLLCTAVFAVPALAQDTGQTTETEDATNTASDPADSLDMGRPIEEAEAGGPYVREEFGDWQIRCLNNPDGPDPCQMYQLLADTDGNPVAEIAMFPLPEDSRAAAGANIVAPLETYLPAELTLSVDGSAPRKYPFTFCSGRPFSPFLSNGCVSRVGFDDDAVTQFKRGAAATLTLVPAAAPDRTIDLTISLIGFTAAFDAQTAPAEAE